MRIKDVYKATQCTDINDCDIAIEQVKTIAHQSNWTPSLQKRIASLTKKKEQLLKKI